jgi:hypothetical protein
VENVFTESGFETSRGDPVTAMVSQVVGENLAMYPEIRMRAANRALHLGQRETYGAQKAQSSVFPCSGSH